MTAAITARRFGLETMVIDEQSEPGGQIWRSIEHAGRRDDILGPAYVEGREIAASFRASGAIYSPGTQLWQVEPGFRAFVTCDGRAQAIKAKAIVFATGAQERPVPFPGWTLPGVLTVGAAQILLKNSGQIPTGPVWIAGCGPLPLLYAVQLLRAGGELAGYLDTTPPGQWRSALRYLPRALLAVGNLLKGLAWQAKIRTSKTSFISGVSDIRAIGEDRVEELAFRIKGGTLKTVEANTLLVHEGVVPSVHPAMSLHCEMRWDAAQDCFSPVLDEWGEATLDNLFIAGDGAGIAGAQAALFRGEIAALRIAVKLGRLSAEKSKSLICSLRRKLDQELAARPFLDAMFRPRPEIFSPADETIVCRCEAVTAGQIRLSALVGQPGPNQIKAALRSGMGPCQGRQCGYTVTRILAATQNRTPEEVGFLNIRPPLKPVTLGELASLNQPVPHGQN